jgi:pimeloyl-ACP methyl ester carboxylesterase
MICWNRSAKSGQSHSMRKRIVWIGLGALTLAASLAVGYLAARRSAPPVSRDELMARYGVGARQIEIAGVSVNYRDEGSGPALVLLHGSFGSLRMFDDMARELRSSFRVIRYDQPPSGLSGPVPQDFTLSSEQFLSGLLDQLNVGPVVLLGTSSGGIIAYRFAAAYPQRVMALVLSNVPPSAPVDNAGARRRLPLTLQWSIGTCLKYAKPWSKTCWRDFLVSNFWRQARVTDNLVSEYYDLNRRPGASGFSSMTAIMRKDDEVRRLLAAVTAPTLLVWGTRDPVLPLETAQLLATRLTSTKVETQLLEDVSHYPPLEAPSEVSAATIAFLKTIPLSP